MGYLLKETLRTVCGINQWSYAVFWKFACQNPKLLIWEDCYYEPTTYLNNQHIPGIENTPAFSRVSDENQPARDGVHLLVTKMMTDNYIHLLGEGIVGRAAFTGNPQWIFSNNFSREAHPPEVSNEACLQFTAGIKTLAVIPVLPHGVIQLGSTLSVMEDMGFVNDVRTLVHQLGSVPGALLSENYARKEPAPENAQHTNSLSTVPIYLGRPISDSFGRLNKINSSPFIFNSCTQQGYSSQASGLVGQTSDPNHVQDNPLPTASTFRSPFIAQILAESHADHCQVDLTPTIKQNLSFENQLRDGITRAAVIPSNGDFWANEGVNLQGNSAYTNQSALSSSPANNSCLGSRKPGILSNTRFNDHVSDSISMSSSLMCCQKSNESPNPLVEHQEQNLSTYSLSDAPKPATDSTFCVNHPNRLLTDSSKPEVSSSNFADHLRSENLSSDSPYHRHHSTDEKCMQSDLCATKERPKFGDDLFDILGFNFKHKFSDRSWNNVASNGPETSAQNLDVNNCGTLALHSQDASSDLFPVNERELESRIFLNTNDHLLDAVISKAHSLSKQSSDDNVSCRTTLTKTSSTSAHVASSSSGATNGSILMQKELPCAPEFAVKAGGLRGSSSISGFGKDGGGSCSKSSSIYASQISSWVEQKHDMKKQITETSNASIMKSNDSGKSVRKRGKPGENPRPRPKDRQLIQDRVKELREMIPNGAKCSIDALLERTIKHMLFLQSVTKHADTLKQTESKMISRDGGLLLKDNFEGGVTWAYEVGSQSMVCPIIVEDLSTPRQMLVEIVYDERGLFLEIADSVRGLGLTILKGVMEARNKKIWSRFTVEAKRDVTRMEIFISLVRLLEQKVVSTTATPANCVEMAM